MPKSATKRGKAPAVDAGGFAGAGEKVREARREEPKSSEKGREGPEATPPHGFPTEGAGGAEGQSSSQAEGVSGFALAEVGAIARKEVCATLAEYFPRLPRASTLHCSMQAGKSRARFVITTSRVGFSQAREKRLPAFVGGELLALAHATQNDRVLAVHMREFLRTKQTRPSWRLTPDGAFNGMPICNAEDLSWTIGQLLYRLHVTLDRVEFHETPKAEGK